MAIGALNWWKMGEKITLNKVIGIVLVVTGVLILVTKGRLSTLLSISFVPGDALMLLAAFTFATYNIPLHRRPKEMSFWTL
jgi:drug/metabolite transporter (DMT)-like permease